MARGAAVALAGLLFWLFALATGSQPLYQLAAGLASLTLLCLVWVGNSLWGLRLQRPSPTTRAQVGQTLHDAYQLSNTSPLPKPALEVRDHSTLPGHRAGAISNIGPREQLNKAVDTVSQLRGVYTLGPSGVAASDPFGLFTIERRLAPPSEIIVYPEVVDLGGFTIPGTVLTDGARIRKPTQVQTLDPAGTRPYVYGDSVRRIHWLSSAHSGQLMVKEFEYTPAADIWIFLDLDRSVHLGSGIHSTEEYAVTAAASLAAHMLRAGRAVGLVASGRSREVLLADRGERQLIRLLELLAIVKANGHTPLRDVLWNERPALRRSATAVVISPSLDEAWAGVLAQVAHKGTRAAALLVEAATFGEASPVTMQVAALTSAGIPTYLIKRAATIRESIVAALDFLPAGRAFR
ncbi:MAG: DUF58 domain-containing protein [Chloroflexota bacterium]|nr:DUF58 domain-containing protein [Chloroflexota bacterium]